MSCDVCDEGAPLISSSFCAVHGFFSDHVPCHVTKLIFLSFRARCSTFFGVTITSSVGYSGKAFSAVRKGSVTQCKDQSVPTPKRLVTNTRRWNCAVHPLFCDSALTGPLRMLRPSCCVVRHPTPRFLPPRRLTQSFSQFHLSVPSSSFRLLSTFHLSPLSSTTTHLLSHPSNHLPTLHPTHPTSHSTQMIHAQFSAGALGIQRTALDRPGVCEQPSS